MTPDQKAFTYYIYNDLRATQNHNPDGHCVQQFPTRKEAIQAFDALPKEWTTALGIQISEHSALDLVQRREGEPVIVADYLRIPDYYGNPSVQDFVRQLQSEWNIQWMSDFRVLGSKPLLYPIPLELDFARDPYINGKHLVPDNPRHLITSVSEMFVEGEGWLPIEDVWDMAQKSGYDDPHTPKVTMMHVRYTDERGSVQSGDIHPYQYLLLLERTKLMEHDKKATKELSEAVEIYLYRNNPSDYAKLFGYQDRMALVDPSSKKRVKDQTIETISHMIDTRDTTSLTQAVVSCIDASRSNPLRDAEARELLGRVLNIPENDERKLALDLRIHASSTFRSFYQQKPSIEVHTKSNNVSLPEIG